MSGKESSVRAREKRANLSSGLLVAKDIPSPVLRPVVVSPAAVGPAPTDRGDDDRDPPPVAAAPPKPSGENVLSRKGTASAAGFRPDYWSYDHRTGAPGDDRGEAPAVVPLFQDPPARPDRQPEAAPESPVRPKLSRSSALVVAFGFLAVIASASLTWLAPPQSRPAPEGQAVSSRAEPPAPAVAARDEAAVIDEAGPPPAPASQPEPPPETKASDPAPAAGTASATEVHDAAPVEAAPAPAVVTALSPEAAAALIARGDQLLATGDIAAARLFYQRAAEHGSGLAATAAGRTFDPLFLAAAHARGIRGDAASAAAWYRRAASAGDPQAPLRLERLTRAFPGELSAPQ
jgi:hypothetical protein